MKRNLHLRAGMVALAGMAVAATAALAYERPETRPHASILLGQDSDPGVDFMITGPVGPSEKPVVRSQAAAAEKADRPLRRRMHLQ